MKEKFYTVSYIYPLSVAKIASILFVILASIVGVVSYVSYAAVFFVSQTTNGSGQGSVRIEPPVGIDQLNFGIVMSVLIMYTLAGFFIGYVGAFVYNILAPKIGGIRFKVSG